MPTYTATVRNKTTFALLNIIMPNSGISPNTGVGGSLTVYSGVQPTAETVANNWSSYRTTNAICIGHAPGVWTWTPQGNTIYATIGPSVTVLNTGTATWAILWDAAVTNTQAALSALPDERFAVVPVGTTSSNAIVRFVDVNIVATGGTLTPYSSGFTNIPA